MSTWMVGVDTGGTFTDLIAVEQQSGAIRVAKVPSVPADPSVAVLDALGKLFTGGVDPADVELFVHGTTVATNAILEHKGVVTGLLINRGFRAIYEARGWAQPQGSEIVDPLYQKPPLLVPQWLTEEVTGRLDYKGEVLVPLDEEDVRRSVRRLVEKGVEAIAVCFLFSFLNPEHERRAAEIAAKEAPNCRISLSSFVLPVIREYPRLSTTVVDAYVGPRVENYLLRLDKRLSEAGINTPQRFLMQSNGGLMRISIGARYPNQTLLSGPAAGVIAGLELARLGGWRDVATLDMGGTSTDISLIVNGHVLETNEGRVAGQDVGTPMLRVRTLGAGGGTIAWIGKDGLLKVGPRSSGAVPGPACYGRGGDEPTVTDANLVLGLLSGETPLAGTLKLDEALARKAIEEKLAKPLGIDVAEAATGIIRIVNNQMSIDLRLTFQEYGQDPRKFALVTFGGAGPLHAAYIARAVGIQKIIIPPYPGMNCAMGMMQTSVRHSYLRSEVGTLLQMPIARINDHFAILEKQALEEASEEGFEREQVTLTRLIDFRYPHQGYTLPVQCPPLLTDDEDKRRLKRAFDQVHQEVYGQCAPEEDAEIVTFQMHAEIRVPRFEMVEIHDDGGRGGASRALKGERQLLDADHQSFVTAKVYDRALLRVGDRIEGPAIVDQFDTTTLILSEQNALVDRFGVLIIENPVPQ